MMYHTICINYERPTRALCLSIYMPIYIDNHVLKRDLLMFASTSKTRSKSVLYIIYLLSNILHII